MYLVQYSITNHNAFLIILAFGYVLHSNDHDQVVTVRTSSAIPIWQDNSEPTLYLDYLYFLSDA
jgi:hypothetical protein